VLQTTLILHLQLIEKRSCRLRLEEAVTEDASRRTDSTELLSFYPVNHNPGPDKKELLSLKYLFSIHKSGKYFCIKNLFG
jgi:hypothetical protein